MFVPLETTPGTLSSIIEHLICIVNTCRFYLLAIEFNFGASPLLLVISNLMALKYWQTFCSVLYNLQINHQSLFDSFHFIHKFKDNFQKAIEGYVPYGNCERYIIRKLKHYKTEAFLKKPSRIWTWFNHSFLI